MSRSSRSEPDCSAARRATSGLGALRKRARRAVDTMMVSRRLVPFRAGHPCSGQRLFAGPQNRFGGLHDRYLEVHATILLQFIGIFLEGLHVHHRGSTPATMIAV